MTFVTKRHCVCQGGRTRSRIHMAYRGHPLVGDPLYAAGGGVKPPAATAPAAAAAAAGDASGDGCAAAAMPGDDGYHLHAWKLQLQHPTTGEHQLLAINVLQTPDLCVPLPMPHRARLR